MPLASPRSSIARAQFDLMEAINAPWSAWQDFAHDLTALQAELETQLETELEPVRIDLLRQAVADVQRLIGAVAAKLAS